jgi:hypothetical protein
VFFSVFAHFKIQGGQRWARWANRGHFVGQSAGLKPPIYASISRNILGAGRLAVAASDLISILWIVCVSVSSILANWLLDSRRYVLASLI